MRGATLHQRFRQLVLVCLVAVLTVTTFQPSTVMAFFNFNNPAEPQRMDVAPLKTAAVSTVAKPPYLLAQVRMLATVPTSQTYRITTTMVHA